MNQHRNGSRLPLPTHPVSRGPLRWLSGLVAATMLVAVLVTLTTAGQSSPGSTSFVDAAASVSVSNPSLESDRNHDRVPDCWQPRGHGKGTYAFTWRTTGHLGRHSERVTITGYRYGMRGLFVRMGTGGCGPALTPGHRYALSGWYATGGRARVTAFYQAASGTWVRWASGPVLPSATRWTHASFVSPAVPAGATGLSFGIALRSNGALVTDDYAIRDTAPSSASPAATTTSGPTAQPTTTAAATDSASPVPSVTASAATTYTPPTNVPPPAGGYFTDLVAPGNPTALPGDAACTAAVHRSTWEPRPDNNKPNHTLVDPAAVHQAFAQRPRSGGGANDPRWDSWLLPRVDGQFTGTTDEIIQWAACKWGLPDNYLRAEADTESTWFQYDTYASGRCVDMYGCADWFSSEPASARSTYCAGLATSGGYDYQHDFGANQCPKTFSIAGVMSWWNPSWDPIYAGNQNGTFPYTRDSTAMAMDYMASQIRGCYEGWQWELGSGYAAGDLWGCAGQWYDGAWHDADAETYISHVKANETAKHWLTTSFYTEEPDCSPTYGCPGPATKP